MKKKSLKLSNLERNRYSLFSDDIDHCYICGSRYNLTWHEIYAGRNRINSMKYGLCLRLCINCHRIYQDDSNFNEHWHIKGQKKFKSIYPELDFLDIFYINYL